MSTISLQVNSVALGTATKTWTISDADITRLVNWATANFATLPTAQTPNPPALTYSQALLAWANNFMTGTINNVSSYLQVIAVNALPAVTPISAT